MVDGEDRPTVIDKGSNKVLGSVTSQMRSPDWRRENLDTSSKINDKIGLKKIEEWLLSPKVKMV